MTAKGSCAIDADICDDTLITVDRSLVPCNRDPVIADVNEQRGVKITRMISGCMTLA